jgi:transcriptional regulator with XRE-family HTH domain
MNSGAVQLLDWRARRGHSQADLGRILGCDATMVSHLEGGRRLPRLRLSVKIQEETGIPCAAWLSRAREKSDGGVPATAPKRLTTKRKAA